MREITNNVIIPDFKLHDYCWAIDGYSVIKHQVCGIESWNDYNGFIYRVQQLYIDNHNKELRFEGFRRLKEYDSKIVLTIYHSKEEAEEALKKLKGEK